MPGGNEANRGSQVSGYSNDDWDQEDQTVVEAWEAIFQDGLTLAEVFEVIDVIDYLKSDSQHGQSYADYYKGVISYDDAESYLDCYQELQNDAESDSEIALANQVAFERIVFRLQRVCSYAESIGRLVDYEWETYREDIDKLRSALASTKHQHEAGEVLLKKLAQGGVIAKLYAYTGRDNGKALSGMKEQTDESFQKMCETMLGQLEQTIKEAKRAIILAAKLNGNIQDFVAMRAQVSQLDSSKSACPSNVEERLREMSRQVAILKQGIKPPPPLGKKPALGLGAQAAKGGLMSHLASSHVDETSAAASNAKVT